jgi:hypothetical protein
MVWRGEGQGSQQEGEPPGEPNPIFTIPELTSHAVSSARIAPTRKGRRGFIPEFSIQCKHEVTKTPEYEECIRIR